MFCDPGGSVPAGEPTLCNKQAQAAYIMLIMTYLMLSIICSKCTTLEMRDTSVMKYNVKRIEFSPSNSKYYMQGYRKNKGYLSKLLRF